MYWKIQVLKTNWFTFQVTSAAEGNVTERLSGTTPILISRLAKYFYNYWTDISHPIIDYIRLSIGTLRKLVICVSLNQYIYIYYIYAIYINIYIYIYILIYTYVCNIYIYICNIYVYKSCISIYKIPGLSPAARPEVRFLQQSPC